MTFTTDKRTLKHGAKHTVRTFGSLDAFIEQAEGESRSGADSGRRGRGNNWDGNLSYREALEMARTGDESARDAMLPMVRRVVESMREVEAPIATSVWDVCGGEVDIARFCGGVPECMVDRRIEMTPSKGRTVRMLITLGGDAAVTAEMMHARGVAVMALMEALHRTNYTLDVWAEFCTEDRTHYRETDNRLSRLIHLVEPGTQPDFARLAFVMTSAAMHRRLSFAELETNSPHVADHGYGFSSPPECKDIIGADVVVRIPNGYSEAEKNPESWIRTVLESVGVEFTG
jgi:hypothetical protein